MAFYVGKYSIIFFFSFMSASRLVCISAANRPDNRLCKWAAFKTEPIEWFELKNPFIGTEGKCPGCNKEISGGFGGFLNSLNPKNWFDGISSLSEGVAVVLEVIVYIVILIVLICLWKKCIYPFIKWALCSQSNGRSYELANKSMLV